MHVDPPVVYKNSVATWDTLSGCFEKLMMAGLVSDTILIITVYREAGN